MPIDSATLAEWKARFAFRDMMGMLQKELDYIAYYAGEVEWRCADRSVEALAEDEVEQLCAPHWLANEERVELQRAEFSTFGIEFKAISKWCEERFESYIARSDIEAVETALTAHIVATAVAAQVSRGIRLKD